MTQEEINAIKVINNLIDAKLKALAEDTEGYYFERQRQMSSLYALQTELNKLNTNPKVSQLILGGVEINNPPEEGVMPTTRKTNGIRLIKSDQVAFDSLSETVPFNLKKNQDISNKLLIFVI